MTKKKEGSQFLVNGLTHYQRNKDYYIERNRLARYRKREYIINIKKHGKCVDCGLADHRVLDFDHTGEIEKSYNVSELISRNWSFDRIDLEISKCELRCANCHRIKTMERAGLV